MSSSLSCMSIAARRKNLGPRLGNDNRKALSIHSFLQKLQSSPQSEAQLCQILFQESLGNLYARAELCLTTISCSSMHVTIHTFLFILHLSLSHSHALFQFYQSHYHHTMIHADAKTGKDKAVSYCKILHSFLAHGMPF